MITPLIPKDRPALLTQDFRSSLEFTAFAASFSQGHTTVKLEWLGIGGG